MHNQCYWPGNKQYGIREHEIEETITQEEDIIHVIIEISTAALTLYGSDKPCKRSETPVGL